MQAKRGIKNISLRQEFPFTAVSVLEIWGNSRSGRDLVVIASHFREADWVMHFGVAKLIEENYDQ